MTVCEICGELADSLSRLCELCEEDFEGHHPQINRECQECGGYEMDDGTSDLCYCYEELENEK